MDIYWSAAKKFMPMQKNMFAIMMEALVLQLRRIVSMKTSRQPIHLIAPPNASAQITKEIVYIMDCIPPLFRSLSTESLPDVSSKP